MEPQNQRIIGFDLARAYAIFGMYIVNFNVVFGNYYDTSTAGKLLSLFSGNSSTVFVMLAGMGVALMSNRKHYTMAERRSLKHKILKRATFLLVIGLLLSLWWPADILHFYAVYMLAAAFLLFMNKKYLLYVAAIAITIFHGLLLLIPFETGWNFETLEYKDFWSIQGFFRSTFYNGWNAVFPWLAYFTIGMYLGRLDWTLSATQRRMFLIGLCGYLLIALIQTGAPYLSLSEDELFYIQADYLPPFLPFVISTLAFGLMLISFFMYVSRFVTAYSWANDLAKTGQMTLTHYLSHVTIGMVLFALFSGKEYTAKISGEAAASPLAIFAFSLLYFIISYYFSKIWTKRYKNGPFEWLMRKTSG